MKITGLISSFINKQFLFFFAVIGLKMENIANFNKEYYQYNEHNFIMSEEYEHNFIMSEEYEHNFIMSEEYEHNFGYGHTKNVYVA